jgi:UDP-N-acetylmuramate--L-alanine ligase
MRGVALAARELGYEVTGSDASAQAPGSDLLDEQGFTWWREPAPERLNGVAQVIISGGSKPDHPEIVWAQQQGVPVRSFAEFVGGLAAEQHRIVLSGTHGKTTTSSLVAWLLESAGRHPDFLIGIKPHNFDSSVRLAGSAVIVFEGDEYSSSQVDPQPKFNYYHPDVLVVTSLEMDHPDVFKDLAEIKQRFRTLIASLPSTGRLIWWRDSGELESVVTQSPAPVESYGLADADWTAEDVRFEPTGLRFGLCHQGNVLGQVTVGLYGEHNVLNALAASAVALAEGLSFAELQQGMASFQGASRRFELVSQPGAAVTIVDDYAHHPTEVAATIAAAKAHFPGRVLAIFRPHTYSRTSTLLEEYRQAFSLADVAWITDIEGARESGQEQTVSGADIANKAAGNVEFEPDRAQLVERVVAEASSGDLVLAMTVGGYDGLVRELNEKLNREEI